MFSDAYAQHPSTVLFLFGLTLSTDESKVRIGPEPEPINPEPLNGYKVRYPPEKEKEQLK